MLVYGCLHLQAPVYLQNMVARQPGLRSAGNYQCLVVSKTTRKTFADRSFGVAGPKLWNCLSDSVKRSDTLVNSRPNSKPIFLKKHLMFNYSFILTFIM